MVLAALLMIDFGSLLQAKAPTLIVNRPTVIAFFPPVTQKQLDADPDTNETLADFQLYASSAAKPLHAIALLRDIRNRRVRQPAHKHFFSRLRLFHANVRKGYDLAESGREGR